jgi:hypothetical protein
MALTTAPLFSLGASGSIGKAIVYSKWKGLSYARQHVVPSNPRSVGQSSTRDCFQWVHDAYKYLDPAVTESWIEYTKGKPMTPANAWQQANLPPLRGKTDILEIVFSKPVNSGPPATTITAVPAATSITITAATPTMPPDWTITHAIFIAMEDQEPAGEMEQKISHTLVSTTAPYTADITGLKAAQAYVCGAWFKYLRPDNVVAFGGSVNALATTP